MDVVEPANQAADFTSGLLIGLVNRENFDNLTSCFADRPDDFNTSIKNVLTLFGSKTNENIAMGVQALANTMKKLPDQISNCEKS